MNSRTDGTLKRNKQFDHAYVIIRIDNFQGPDALVEEKIAVTKIYTDREAALREVERLNKLQADDSARYFAQIGRLERGPVSSLQDTSSTEEEVHFTEQPVHWRLVGTPILAASNCI